MGIKSSSINFWNIQQNTTTRSGIGRIRGLDFWKNASRERRKALANIYDINESLQNDMEAKTTPISGKSPT